MRSTRFVKQSYQYFVDINTSTSNLTRITFTAGGNMPFGRLSPFFSAFKYWKLGPVSVRFTPASTMPVDPSGLSYAEGESTTDPRDFFNVGLLRITNGENVDPVLSKPTGQSVAELQRYYYTTMLDPRWRKFDLQAGFKFTAYPRFWGVMQTRQTFTQSFGSMTATAAASRAVDGVGRSPVAPNEGVAAIEFYQDSDTQGLAYSQTNADGPVMNNMILQNQRIRMSWQPTDMFNNGVSGSNTMPEVDLFTVILPKAFKTLMYYRVFITETVYFRSPVAMNPIILTRTDDGSNPTYLRYPSVTPIDRYVRAIPPTPMSQPVQSGLTYYQGNPANAGNIMSGNNPGPEGGPF